MDDRDLFIHTKQGQFEYDADFDVYRRQPEPRELTHLSQFGWIYVTVVLTAICFYVTLYA
jgi:hypothetical protein